MHLTYAKMLAIVMRENMKLGDNTLNNERLTFVNTKFLPKYSRIVASTHFLREKPWGRGWIHLWWQFFRNFVYGDVVYAQTWEVLALKNCIEPPYTGILLLAVFTLGLEMDYQSGTGSLCTVASSPQTPLLRFFLRGGGGCTQAIWSG